MATWRRGGGPRARSLGARRPPLLPPAPDSPLGERGFRGHVVRAQCFRFSEEPGPGAEGAVLEVHVPQVRAAAPAGRTSGLCGGAPGRSGSDNQGGRNGGAGVRGFLPWDAPRSEKVLHLQYGMYVWPCAVVLAQYLWFHRGSLPGKAVLEIGGGVSLPGIMAAKCGAEVILSDSSELPHCLEVCWQSCQMNNLPQVRIIGLTWGHMSQELLALPPQDILLASDVFFEPEDFEDILTTVYFLMQKNPKVQLWSTYQVRSADWSLEALLYKWDMKCVHIPLESFDADKENIAESALPGRHTVEMLVISFAKDSL
uniref:Histone-arginine methyltransferase METTL23 n=1 Tax=Equus asinus TaxID=9793 RepID=A0A9L0JEX5_EQUAS